MTGTELPPDRGPNLLLDEEASAAAEFVILIPVYLLMMVGLFMTGNLMQIRQGVVAAVRFHAWSDKSAADEEIRTAFFRGIPGTYSAGSRNKTPGAKVDSSGAGEFQRNDLEPTGQALDRMGSDRAHYNRSRAASIAADALNNKGGERPLELVEATGTFTYDGLRITGLPGLVQSTDAAVLLSTAAERKTYEAGKTPHPINDWRVTGNSYALEGSAGDKWPYAPMSPLLDEYFTYSPNPDVNYSPPEAGDAGIWYRDARVKGNSFNPYASEKAEREFANQEGNFR